MNKIEEYVIPIDLDEDQRLIYVNNLGHRIGISEEIRIDGKILSKDYSWSADEIEEFNSGYFEGIEQSLKK